VTTSKTKQFCEISSFFELDSIKNEAIDKMHNPLRLPRETTIESPKVDRTLVLLTF